jgi:hypothetical protein
VTTRDGLYNPERIYMSEEEKGITEETLKLAIDALKQTGYHVLTQEQFTDRLKKATKEIDPLKAQVGDLEEKLLSTSKVLKGYEDKNKSAEQRIADELKAKQDMIDAYQVKLDKQIQLTDAKDSKAREMFLINRLSDILDGSLDTQSAVSLAKLEVSGLGVESDAEGNYSLTYTGPDKLPGDARDAVMSWYKNKTIFHPPSGEGVPTNSVNPPSNGRKDFFDLNSEDRFDRVFFGGEE